MSARPVLAGALLALLALAASPARALHDVLEPLFAANVTGGTFGWRLERLGGPAITARNSSFAFYPASSIKTLHHLGAMRLVEFGLLDLDTTQVPVCSVSTNCSDAPNVTVVQCGAQFGFLDDVLRNMMVPSDNESTNAVQELIGATVSVDPQPASSGRQFLNNLAQGLIGTSADMRVLHKFNCNNVDNAPNENHATLADLGLLYEAIAARPDVIEPQTRADMKSLMLDEDNGFFTNQLTAVIDTEAAELELADIAAAFKALVRLIYKDGSVTNDSKRYDSFAGLLQLPINNGNAKRIYTFSMFAVAADSVASNTDRTVSAELLRPVIRSALQSWFSPSLPGFAFGGLSAAAGAVQTLMAQATDRAQRRLLGRAARDLERAAGVLASGAAVPTRALARMHRAQLWLRLAARRAPSRSLDVLRDRIADIAGHLATNARATAMGESLHPRAGRLTDAAGRLGARGDAQPDPLLATGWYRASVAVAAAALRGRTQRDCPAYDGAAPGCPENAPGVGLPPGDGGGRGATAPPG